ncbi:bifunctional 2-polyprenyl-6-hydroxyphenol methylase/3-demethylubiquinol 3-O-methyltransferase UbiG [Curtobacterium sp. ZW137]|uniref:class I SAM-dependent methyltransferase n=1 Tax=Curtobacterium sp. ZW137 TaxID=2485104 RepID=UPI000F9041DF|nr:class I SAM-dependent methyltransferase [Curtobacterium sp. ZW137]ROP58527.1 methyltransferase family protein [Curtobacterium sp. ZW137]
MPIDAEPSAATYWEQRYADEQRMWSGRVNAVLADVAAQLVPGTALDLGCGEGGDVLWLAEQGWTATGVDLSPTAAARGDAAAAAAGLDTRTRFVAADLATWEPGERFDLVTASFLQSWPVEIPREAILRRATGFVESGGHLLVTAHAAAPHAHDHEHAQEHEHEHELDGYRFPTPEDDLRVLDLDASWEVVAAELRPRAVPRDDGSVHELLDSVVLVRRA